MMNVPALFALFAPVPRRSLSAGFALICCGLFVSQGLAATYYVSDSSGADANNGLSWAAAKKTIQAGVQAASANDTVLVTNGTYQTGGYYNYDYSYITNRVFIDKPLTMQSVNGPEVTIIRGFQDDVSADGLNSVRCLWIQPDIDATVSGFTLTDGGTIKGFDGTYAAGGGAYQEHGSSPRATLNHCILTGNKAANRGGAVYGFIVNNSMLSSNAALTSGGGAYESILNHCIVENNVAQRGGGTDKSILNNCLVVGNEATYLQGGGAYESTLKNCTVVDNFSYDGAAVYDSANYNCILYFNTTGPTPNQLRNFQDSPFGNCLYVNCYSSVGITSRGTNNIKSSSSQEIGPRFVDRANGDYRLDVRSICLNAGTNTYATGSTGLGGNPRIIGPTVDIGAYETDFINTNFWHVSTNGNDAADGLSWETAKRTIQNAVDYVIPFGTVLVSNGVYDTGGQIRDIAPDDYLKNRVCIGKPLTLRSANGPQVTTIKGFQDTLSSNGSNSVRCVLIDAPNVTVEGFTLADGGTWSDPISNFQDSYGAGVYAKFYDEFIEKNTSFEGSIVRNCIIRDNHAERFGGGAYFTDLENCVLWGNSAASYGAAVVGTLNNCTVWGNSASIQCGGVGDSTLFNSIVYGNTAPSSANHTGSTFSYSGATPLPAGSGNFTNDPMFVNAPGGNFQLQAGSPARDSGSNSSAPSGPDLAGNPRVVHGYVDVGAYEYQGGTVQADFDDDGMGNGDERLAGTSFTDENDVFQIQQLDFPGAASISFSTVLGRQYAIEQTDDLVADPIIWSEITNGIPGTGGSIAISDPEDATNRYYRARVTLQP